MEHQHNKFKKVNVNAHAALCCSLCELSDHIYDMEKRGKKDKNENQNVRPVSLFPPSLPLFIVISLCRNVHSQKLPDRALVHFWRRVGEVVAVSAAVEGEGCKGRTGSKNIWGHTVQGSRYPWLWTGWVSWVVRHDVWKALYFTGWMVAWDRMVHNP